MQPKSIAWLTAGAATMLTGIITAAHSENSGSIHSAGWVQFGWVLIIVPVLAAIWVALRAMGRETARVRAQHQAWLDTLSPEQRLNVIRAEQAAAWAATAGAAIWLHERHERNAAQHSHDAIYGFDRPFQSPPAATGSTEPQGIYSPDDLLDQSRAIRESFGRPAGWQ